MSDQYRTLNPNETIQEGDEFRNLHSLEHILRTVSGFSIGKKPTEATNCTFRRKVQETPAQFIEIYERQKTGN